MLIAARCLLMSKLAIVRNMQIWALTVIIAMAYSLDSYAKNPSCKVSESMAKRDLLQNLSIRYPNSYSTQKLLLKSGLNAYRELCSIPSSSKSNYVLEELTNRYYPSFSTILLLYKKNMEAYDELHGSGKTKIKQIQEPSNLSQQSYRNPLVRYGNKSNSESMDDMVGKNKPDALKVYLSDKNVDKSKLNGPLLLSCKKGYAGVVEVLLDNGADVAYSSRDSFTALHYAMRSGNKRVVKLLLDHGADTEAKDRVGRRPIYTARQLHYDDIVEMLIDAGSYE